MSISGQNERWAQLNAYQSPSSSPSGQNGGGASTIGTTASSGSAGNIASGAGTSGALSDGMSLALMAFGGWGNGSATASQAGGTSGASSTGAAPASQDGTSLGAQLLTDVQSLVSALTGTASAPTATSAASGTTGTGAATGLTDTVQQDLQTVASDLATMASASGSSQPGGVGSPSSGPPPWSNRSSNPGYSDSIQQQFALSAYTANTQSGLDGSATSLSATSSLASINV